MTIMHTTTAAQRQVWSSRVLGLAPFRDFSALSQTPIPSRVCRPLTSSSLGIMPRPQPHSSSHHPASGSWGELRAAAAALSPKSAGISRYGAPVLSEG
ncbi:hypothetical protein CTheo_8121 [Ceratobasidium theobromae]|uniref:Uncharacterized protein n=1 Tax=Ceratobasidium theobromae TaxID=1582974 RepID=A0A5N5Q9K4_9AGAM|nr:hypothetical protein CTheo_8121 [Ceratobasidium theobromae]